MSAVQGFPVPTGGHVETTIPFHATCGRCHHFFNQIRVSLPNGPDDKVDVICPVCHKLHCRLGGASTQDSFLSQETVTPGSNVAEFSVSLSHSPPPATPPRDSSYEGTRILSPRKKTSQSSQADTPVTRISPASSDLEDFVDADAGPRGGNVPSPQSAPSPLASAMLRREEDDQPLDPRGTLGTFTTQARTASTTPKKRKFDQFKWTIKHTFKSLKPSLSVPRKATTDRQDLLDPVGSPPSGHPVSSLLEEPETPEARNPTQGTMLSPPETSRQPNPIPPLQEPTSGSNRVVHESRPLSPRQLQTRRRRTELTRRGQKYCPGCGRILACPWHQSSNQILQRSYTDPTVGIVNSRAVYFTGHEQSPSTSQNDNDPAATPDSNVGESSATVNNTQEPQSSDSTASISLTEPFTPTDRHPFEIYQPYPLRPSSFSTSMSNPPGLSFTSTAPSSPFPPSYASEAEASITPQAPRTPLLHVETSGNDDSGRDDEERTPTQGRNSPASPEDFRGLGDRFQDGNTS